MAITRRRMDIPSARVWDVLADATTYADWVVGAERIRGVEGEWPDVGTKLHHKVGVWPLYVRDNTEVTVCEAPRHLELEARTRPLGRARISFTLVPEGEHVVVEMLEVPVSPLPMRLATPLLDPLIHVRNTETLRRLERRACRLSNR